MLGPRQRQRFCRDPSAMFGVALLGLLLVFAVVGPWLAADPNVSHFGLGRSPTGGPPGPSWAHPLGTDRIYRDVLARLAHGARLSLTIAVAATTLALTIGTFIGVAAGWLEGTRLSKVDDVLMRVVDVALAFPYLLLITAIGVAIDRADATTVTLVLGLTSWTGVAKVVRAKTLQIKSQRYILAARALGAATPRIVYRHVLPAVWPTLLVIGSQAMAMMILAEAVLGYLTVGIEPPQATWGRMLFEAESYIEAEPLLLAVPGLAILIAVLGFSRVGDGLRDALDTQATDVPTRWRRARYAADLVIIGAAFALAGFANDGGLSAPHASAGSSEQPRYGGVLRVASTGAITELDPALAYDEASRAIDDLIFATLVTWNQAGELVPDLAERVELSDDGTRVSLVLREGLRFHDGAPLGAADVKRSLERSLHPRTPCPGSHLYKHIVGYDAYNKDASKGLAGIVVDGPLALHIDLAQPDASFLSLLGMGFAAPVCPSSGTFVDAKTPADPCGAGPFMLSEFIRGEHVTVTRFDDYHVEGMPFLDGVQWQLGIPARTQHYRFDSGQLDVITQLHGIDAFRYGTDERWAAYRHWQSRALNHYIFLNTQMPPFDNRHLRRAVSFAVDPRPLEQIRSSVGATTRVLPPSVPGPAADEPMRRHDVQAALREMELAGFAYDPVSGEGGYPDPIDYITMPNTFAQVSAEVFQQQLAAVGIRIRLRLVAFATWLVVISEPGQAAMGWRGWGADYPDPSTFFEPILTSSAIQPRGTQNVSFFSHAEFDDVVSRARTEADVPKRMALYQRAEEIVRDEAPLVPVYGARSLQLHQPHVRGYQPHPVIPQRYRSVWLTRGAP